MNSNESLNVLFTDEMRAKALAGHPEITLEWQNLQDIIDHLDKTYPVGDILNVPAMDSDQTVNFIEALKQAGLDVDYNRDKPGLARIRKSH